MKTPQLTRKEFCQFLGQSALIGFLPASVLKVYASGSSGPKLEGLGPIYKDAVSLAKGLSYRRVIDWKDKINPQGDEFGFNNDYIAFQTISSTEAWMWVNHEYIHPGMVSGDWKMERKKEQIDQERRAVGGSILKVKKGKKGWEVIPSKENTRVDGTTKIPFSSGIRIEGSTEAEGTLANCAGGHTPWGTFLTCEENYDDYYGERKRNSRKIDHKGNQFHWEKHYANPPEHYGWVVEINPQTKTYQKLVGLGRFAHEGATVVRSKAGFPVAYMGDDKNDECLYKFVSNGRNSLTEGTLYVASLEKKQWIELSKNNPLLADFKDDVEIAVYAREAAKRVGGTPLNRPEDVEVHPLTGEVYIALTNNKPKGDFHGSILKISEKNSDHASQTFEHSSFLMGGEDIGLSCPDNLLFDKAGNLWITTDISGGSIGKAPYRAFGNNGLFFVPVRGPKAGKATKVASAPIESEFTGPCLSPDGTSIFLCVQHPGEKSKGPDSLTSHWPDGGSSMPRPAVIEITGPILEELLNS